MSAPRFPTLDLKLRHMNIRDYSWWLKFLREIWIDWIFSRSTPLATRTMIEMKWNEMKKTMGRVRHANSWSLFIVPFSMSAFSILSPLRRSSVRPLNGDPTLGTKPWNLHCNRKCLAEKNPHLFVDGGHKERKGGGRSYQYANICGNCAWGKCTLCVGGTVNETSSLTFWGCRQCCWAQRGRPRDCARLRWWHRDCLTFFFSLISW